MSLPHVCICEKCRREMGGVIPLTDDVRSAYGLGFARGSGDEGAYQREIAQLRGTLSLAEEGLANYAQENERLKRLLNPRLWTREESDAWHRAIPDLYKAFEALRGDVPQPDKHADQG